MLELSKDGRCRGSVHILSRVGRHTTRPPEFRRYWTLVRWATYSKFEFDDWFNYRFRLYETNQLSFVKDATSARTKEFFQGVSDDIVHLGLQPLIWIGATLPIPFNRVCNVVDNFGLDLAVCLGHGRLDDFGNLRCRYDPEIGQLCGHLVTSRVKIVLRQIMNSLHSSCLSQVWNWHLGILSVLCGNCGPHPIV